MSATTPDFDPKGRIPMYTPSLDDYEDWTPVLQVVPLADANVVSSLTYDLKTHRPVLDIDIPAHLIPSSTEGHHHLYLEVDLTHEQYTKLIHTLVEVGILEKGIKTQLDTRGATFARVPWVKKGDTQKKEQQRAEEA